MDYQALLYGPVYMSVGVACVLTVGGVNHNVTVLDKTSGIEVGDKSGVVTVEPACIVRAAELAARGIAPAALVGAVADFNGLRWKVRVPKAKPSPKGEADGEYYLILSRGV